MMDMFFFLKESLGTILANLFFAYLDFFFFFGSERYVANACTVICRRDARKALYLQHGLFDSSMG